MDPKGDNRQKHPEEGIIRYNPDFGTKSGRGIRVVSHECGK